MSVQQENLKEIADAIREKTGTTELFPANTFAEKIRNIEGGGGSVEIVDNLTSTDINKALSANMGRELFETKVDKEEGKGLSTNDFTNEEKEKLARLGEFDDIELKLRDERLKYYGDPNVVPTEDKYFIFALDDETMTASICINDEYRESFSGELIIPYKYVEDNGDEYIVTNISDEGFNGCSNIINILLPNTLTSIGSVSFAACSNLREVVIPEGVTYIGDGIFRGETINVTVTIPKSVTYIEGFLINFGVCVIKCAEGSYADQYAQDWGIPVEYTDEVTKQFVLDNIEIVDSFETNYTDKALSANMGRVLNGFITDNNYNLWKHESNEDIHTTAAEKSWWGEAIYVLETTKANKFSISYSLSGDTLYLNNNKDVQLLNPIYEMVISVPEYIEDDFQSSFCFTSGDTISLSFSGDPIIWRGDDCDSEGAFVPQPNTMYEVSIRRVNTSTLDEPIVVARVGIV